MERKLIANYLVPDDEVWVSPATWERPFSLKAKESTVTDTQQTQPAKCYILLNKGLPINVFSSLEKVEAAAKSNTKYHWASFDVQ